MIARDVRDGTLGVRDVGLPSNTMMDLALNLASQYPDDLIRIYAPIIPEGSELSENGSYTGTQPPYIYGYVNGALLYGPLYSFTNIGKHALFNGFFRNVFPTNLYLALVSNEIVHPQINTLSELDEVIEGTGYISGGIQLNRNSTDFDVLVEDDVNNRSYVQLQDIILNAIDGSINGIRFGVFTDDNVVVGDRKIYCYFYLGEVIDVEENSTFVIQDIEIRLN